MGLGWGARRSLGLELEAHAELKAAGRGDGCDLAEGAGGFDGVDAGGVLVVEDVARVNRNGKVVAMLGRVAAAKAATVAESLLLASATGIDLDAFVQVLSSGSGASTQLELKSGPMREHDYATLFKTEHLLKDVRLCLEQAQAAGVPFPAAAHARDLLTAAMGRGYAEQDYASIIEAAEGLAGRRL